MTICYNSTMSTLCAYRKSLNVSQTQAANVLGVSLRTYQRYEKSSNLSDSKLNAIKVVLDHEFAITEEKGKLTISEIRKSVLPILDKYNIEMCILFGSYAKENATETSDVDLLVKTDITGLKYFGLVEELRVALHKKVDLITTKQLITSQELLEEILKDGIKLKWLTTKIEGL